MRASYLRRSRRSEKARSEQDAEEAEGGSACARKARGMSA